MNKEITNRDVLVIMRDGGRQLCEAAMMKWMSPGYYLGMEDARGGQLEYWRTMERRITELYSAIIEEMKKTK